MQLANIVRERWKGVLFCLIIAIPATLLGKQIEVVGGPVFAILFGMVLALVFPKNRREQLAAGVTYTSKKVLQYAVILLGFGMNLSQILSKGAQSLPIIVATISTSLVIAFVLCRVMNVPGKIATLVGVGSSICGGSAIAATAPVIDADDREIAQAISVIFLFNVIAALVFPTLGGMLGLTDEGFGLFAGTAINDTSSVTAAASAWDSMHPGASVLESATVLQLPASITAPIKELSKFFIVMAMAAIGFNTDIVELVKKGGKPIALGFCCWIGIACMSLGMQHVLGIW